MFGGFPFGGASFGGTEAVSSTQTGTLAATQTTSVSTSVVVARTLTASQAQTVTLLGRQVNRAISATQTSSATVSAQLNRSFAVAQTQVANAGRYTTGMVVTIAQSQAATIARVNRIWAATQSQSAARSVTVARLLLSSQSQTVGFGGHAGNFAASQTQAVQLAEALARTWSTAQTQHASATGAWSTTIIASQNGQASIEGNPARAQACGQTQQGRLGDRVLSRAFVQVGRQSAVQASALSATLPLAQTQTVALHGTKAVSIKVALTQTATAGAVIATYRAFPIIQTQRRVLITNPTVFFLRQASSVERLTVLTVSYVSSSTQSARQTGFKTAYETITAPARQSATFQRNVAHLIFRDNFQTARRRGALTRWLYATQPSTGRMFQTRYFNTATVQAQVTAVDGSVQAGESFSCLSAQSTALATAIVRTTGATQPGWASVTGAATATLPLAQVQTATISGRLVSSRELIPVLDSTVDTAFVLVGGVQQTYITKGGIATYAPTSKVLSA